MRRLPPLNALKVFEVVARRSSMTEASDELNVSHSSVSHQIKQMEEYFGQTLFVREGRGIRPTQEAVEFASELQDCFDRIAFHSGQLIQNNKQRGISLNATPSFAMRWLIPKITEFQILNPAIPVKISTSMADDVKDLKEPFDLVFRQDTMKRPGHCCTRILDDTLVPVLAPSYYDRHKPKTAKDLANLTLLHMRSRPDAWTRWFSRQKVDSVAVNASPMFDHFFLSWQAAIAGHGVAIGSLALVEDDLANGRLIAPFRSNPIEEPGFHVLYRKSFPGESTGQLFMNWLLRVADPK